MNDPGPSQRRSEKEIFFEALEKPTPRERAAFLDGACGTNPVQRARVEALLADHFQPDVFMKAPAMDTAAVTSPISSPGNVPAQMLGRYKLLEKIGEGGFGEVWMAEQREPVKRRVALKIIKLGMDSRQIVARFEAERQALAMMDHPNIARIFDAGTTGAEDAQSQIANRKSQTSLGRPYFVMELVRGIKITEHCDQHQLPTRERLDLFIKVCQAIQHAHQKGIIHRDIKPSNILVTLHDGVPVPKVIDFGIAKATQGELTDKTVFTQFQQFIGTPAYISPEQAEMSGLDIDTRADIYSLGVLLYELLVGQTPFDAKEMMQGGLDGLRQIIREKEPLRPSTKLNTLPGDAKTTAGKRRQTEVSKLMRQLQGDLDWIVMKCLEKDRTRRYDTANGLAMDIQCHLANEPVAARPPTAAYRLQKAFRRNKLVFTAAIAVAVALMAGISVSTWQTIRATRAEREQSKLREVAVKALDGEKKQRVQTEMQARRVSESQQHSRRLLYGSDMNLAQQQLKLNNLGLALRLLERHRPQLGEEDLRGWEWRYLWQLTRSSALGTLTNRPTRGWSVSFSPDGSRLAAGWLDGRVDLWDVPGRRWVRAFTDRAPHIGKVAFSPVRNLLAATSETEAVALYDLDSGRDSTLWRPTDQGEWNVWDLEFSQDGSKLVIYAKSNTPELGDAAWVVNVISSRIESHQPTIHSGSGPYGAARLSPDNQRLYLARSDYSSRRYSIQCLDLDTKREVWQTERQQDRGLSALAVSPDGRVLVSGSGQEDPTIRVWEASTGRLLRQLPGHTSWVCKLAFARDGRRLISAAADQTIRVWDTSNWTATQVLRGHIDPVHAAAISEPAQLVASISKNGDLMLWQDDGKNAGDAYRRLPEDLRENQVLSLDHSRLLLLSPVKPPELVDLKRDGRPEPLLGIGSSKNVLGWFGSNILCHWNGTNQIVVRELRGAEFIQRAAIAVDSRTRPPGLAYNAARQFLAWSEGTSSASVFLTSLAAPDRRMELQSDVPGLAPFCFSEDGSFLAALTKGEDSLRVWNVETRRVVVSIDGDIRAASFAAGGRVLVSAIRPASRRDHEIKFYDLVHPSQAPRAVSGRDGVGSLAVSPDGRLVASATWAGQVRLFDPAKGELTGPPFHGHLTAVSAVAFSPDGRRLISASSAPEAVKLWDVGTRQELLTLAGTGTGLLEVRWSADGDVIIVGAPWQAWRAPSWEEIAAAEAKDPPPSDFDRQRKAEIERP